MGAKKTTRQDPHLRIIALRNWFISAPELKDTFRGQRFITDFVGWGINKTSILRYASDNGTWHNVIHVYIVLTTIRFFKILANSK